jgi:hypothetical protein
VAEVRVVVRALFANRADYLKSRRPHGAPTALPKVLDVRRRQIPSSDRLSWCSAQVGLQTVGEIALVIADDWSPRRPLAADENGLCEVISSPEVG